MSRTGVLAAFVAFAVSGSAWAEDYAPRVPAPGEPPPPVAPYDPASPGYGAVEGLQPVGPQPLPPGAVGTAPPPPPGAGLVPCAPPPTCQESARCCMEGSPEYLWPVYAPAGMFRIPWTGEYNPRGLDRHWAVFGGVSMTYDSNIFLADDGDEEDDFIFHTTAGVSYRREGSAYHVAASLVGTYDWYLDHDDQNFFNVFGILDAGWRGACAYVSVSDRLSYSQDPWIIVGGTPTGGLVVEDQDLESYWQNDFGIRAGYEGCRWRAEVAYEMSLFMSEDDVLDALDYADHGFRARFDYYVTPKLSLGATAGVRFIVYDGDEHEDFNVYDVGGTFSWRPTAKFGIMGRVGVSSAEDGDTETSWEADVRASYAATSKLTIDAGYTHTFEPALGASSQLVDNLYVRADYAIAPGWSLDATAGITRGDVIDRFDEDAVEDYTLFYAGAALHHTFNCWLTADLSYIYRQQEREDAGIDYQVHRVTLGLTIVL